MPVTRTSVPEAKTTSKKSTTAVDALAATPPAGLVEIPLAKIESHPDNPRKDLGKLDDLVVSISARGVLQNLVVVPHPTKKDFYLLVIGHRRAAAARKAGLVTVPARVDESMDHRTQIARMLEENLQRTDLTVLEEADAYQGLLDLGMTVEDIAEQTGRALKTVKERVRVAKMPESTRNAIVEHTVTLEQALKLDELQALSQSAYKKLMDTAGYRRIAITDIDHAIATAKKTADHNAYKAELKSAGFKVGSTIYGVPDGAVRLDKLGINPEAHETCPGKGVAADFGPYGDPRKNHTFVCWKADTEHPKEFKKLNAQAPQKDPWQERQEREQRLTKYFTYARAERAAWVSAAFYDDSPETRERSTALTTFVTAVLGQLKGALPVDLFQRTDDGYAILPNEPKDALALFALQHVDRAMPTHHHEWRFSSETTRLAARYLTVLDGLGYELTATERVMLAEMERWHEAIDSAETDEAEEAARRTLMSVEDLLREIQEVSPEADDHDPTGPEAA